MSLPDNVKSETNYNCIQSFNEIPIGDNSLVICDIDDTLIKSKKCLSYFYKIVEEDFIAFPNWPKELILKDACDMQHLHNQMFGFDHTDSDGFFFMCDKIKKSSSQLVFLTARDVKSENFTRKNFQSVGLDYDNFPVYYTNNEIFKGQYILSNINFSSYSNIIFIDDCDVQLNSVIECFPQAQCYKFVIPEYKRFHSFKFQ